MKTYTIAKDDVGKTAHHAIKTLCSLCHETHADYPFEPLGRVLPADIGKISKRINGVWYVENEEQFKERLSNSI